MQLRVRTQVGLWRLQDVNGDDTIESLMKRIESEYHTDLSNRCLYKDELYTRKLNDELTIDDLNLKHGDLIYLNVDENKTNVTSKSTGGKTITKDGNIIAKEFTDVARDTGFRPGMLPLRSMKMHWTLNEFVELDDQFTFNFEKMKERRQGHCTNAKCPTDVFTDFTNYVYNFNFERTRIGLIYGKFGEKNDVKMECIYEPPQDTTDTSFELLEDSNEDKVNKIANYLGLTRVGWIVAHPPREEGFVMSGMEVLTAAELQLECAGGIENTCFTTVKATLNDKGEVVVEAFQAHRLCMEMVAEGALELDVNPGICRVNDTFTAMVEGKPQKELDTSLLISVVPITYEKSEIFVSTFPKCNRLGVPQTQEDLKKQLEKAGKEGWTERSLLTDFNLLIFLSGFLLDVDHDLPTLCNCLVNPEIPLEEGHRMIIKSFAGLN